VADVAALTEEAPFEIYVHRRNGRATPDARKAVLPELLVLGDWCQCRPGGPEAVESERRRGG